MEICTQYLLLDTPVQLKKTRSLIKYATFLSFGPVYEEGKGEVKNLYAQVRVRRVESQFHVWASAASVRVRERKDTNVHDNFENINHILTNCSQIRLIFISYFPPIFSIVKNILLYRFLYYFFS